MEFAGLTGTVKFDKHGLRRDFRLDVLEVSLNRGLAQVSRIVVITVKIKINKTLKLVFVKEIEEKTIANSFDVLT